MTLRYFIFGAGYSGRAIAHAALTQGHAVCGTTRTAEKAAQLSAQGIEPLLFDGSSLSPEIEARLGQTTHLVISIAPGESDPVLAAAGTAIREKMPELRWIGYLSTVGVYGDHGGAWIDEDSDCRPGSRRTQARLEAERRWCALGAETGIPAAILRLSGIYGPGRNALVNLDAGTARRIVKAGQVFNRIHVDDIAGATLLLASQEAGGIFNVTDDTPAPPQDVIAYAAALMGIDAPPEIPFEQAEMTPMARAFYSENKRVSNARLKAAGYRLLFPDYRAALDHLWRSGTWRGRIL